MAEDKSVLDFPEVTDADENDVVYLLRGTGATRDRHQKAVNFFKNGAVYSYTDKTEVYSNIALQKSVDEVISGFEVVPDALMNLTLKPGAAVSFAGYYYAAGVWGFVASPGDIFHAESYDDVVVTIPVADGSNPRIDVVEVRPNKVGGEYVLEVQVISGTPAGYPNAPLKTAGWIKLSEVYVEYGATTIGIEKIHNVAGSYAWRNEAGATIDDGKLYADYAETIPTTYNTFDYIRFFNRFPLDWNGHTISISFTNASYSPPTGFEIGTQSRKNGTLSIYGDGATINMLDIPILNMSNFKDINVFISSLTLNNGYINIVGSYGTSRVDIGIDINPQGAYTSSLDIRQVAYLDVGNTDVTDDVASNQTYPAVYDDIPLIKELHTISGANLADYHSVLINCQVEDSENLSAGTLGSIHPTFSSKYTILDHAPIPLSYFRPTTINMDNLNSFLTDKLSLAMVPVGTTIQCSGVFETTGFSGINGDMVIKSLTRDSSTLWTINGIEYDTATTRMAGLSYDLDAAFGITANYRITALAFPGALI